MIKFEPPTKICSKCKKPKTINFFYPSQWKQKSSMCSTCFGEYNKKRNKENQRLLSGLR